MLLQVFPSSRRLIQGKRQERCFWNSWNGLWEDIFLPFPTEILWLLPMKCQRVPYNPVSACKKLEMKQFKSSLGETLELSRLNSSEPAVYLLLGRIYKELGDSAASVKYFTWGTSMNSEFSCLKKEMECSSAASCTWNSVRFCWNKRILYVIRLNFL